MEEFWLRLLALLALLTRTCSASDPTPVVGAVGGSVTFRIPDTWGYVALWSFGNDPILTVRFWDPAGVVFRKDEYKTRFAVSERGRVLSISQLRMEDAGNYSANIHGQIFTFTLRVYKELTEPTVTCETLECSGGRCRISLRCSVPGAGFGNISYTWTGRGHLWNEESVVLPVNKLFWDEPDPLTCAARNAVSSRNVTVTSLGGLCSGNSTHPPGPDAPSGSWVRIGVVAGVEIAALLSVFLVFFCKSQGHWAAPRGRAGEPSG